MCGVHTIKLLYFTLFLFRVLDIKSEQDFYRTMFNLGLTILGVFRLIAQLYYRLQTVPRYQVYKSSIFVPILSLLELSISFA